MRKPTNHNVTVLERLETLKGRVRSSEIATKCLIGATEAKIGELEKIFDDGKWLFHWNEPSNIHPDFGLRREDGNFESIMFDIKDGKVHVRKLGGYAERHNELQDKLNAWLESFVMIDEDYDYENE